MGLALLKQAIECESKAFSLTNLKKARRGLTDRYRDAEIRAQISLSKDKWMHSTEQKISYLITRMPATYSAVEFVLERLRQIYSDPLNSLLDLGAGPGTATWAASSVFPEIQNFTLIEQDKELIDIGQRLVSHNEALLNCTKWKQENLFQVQPQAHDAVILSYVIGELENLENILKMSWESTQKILIIIEPGSQKGFSTILKARDFLLNCQGNLTLPCPHSNKCPIPPGDWCHFTKRLERSKLHQLCKEGSLGYEDEKFSYCVFSKLPIQPHSSRIISTPLKRSGHVHLKLCTPNGIEDRIVSRRDKDHYKLANKAEWGDHFEC